MAGLPIVAGHEFDRAIVLAMAIDADFRTACSGNGTAESTVIGLTGAVAGGNVRESVRCSEFRLEPAEAPPRERQPAVP